MTRAVTYFIDALGEGGTERSLVEMLPGIRAAGYAPTIVLLGSRGEEGYEGEVRATGVPVVVLPQGRLPTRVRAARALLRRDRPALVHTMLFEATVTARLAAAGLGLPTLTSVVNTSYSVERRRDPGIGTFAHRMVQIIDALTARFLTTHLHAVSTAVATATERHLHVPPEQITVIRRGRAVERLGVQSPGRRKAAREELGIPDAALHVVNVGRQERQKAQDVLLRAFASVITELPDAVLTVAGRTGNATPALRALAEPLGDRVRFLGHVADVGQVLAAADVFVLPSRYEGLPGAVIEAMALGLPVVASDIPAVRELVEPGANALLVPLDDARALAEAVGELARSPQRREEFGVRSRAIFEECFTIEVSTKKMVALYERLIGPTLTRKR